MEDIERKQNNILTVLTLHDEWIVDFNFNINIPVFLNSLHVSLIKHHFYFYSHKS